MPDYICYALTFPGGLHAGRDPSDLTASGWTIPSDTLYSALLVAQARQGGDTHALIESFRGDPRQVPFRVTSAFPRAGNLRFFPMPSDLTRVISSEAIRKTGKSVRRIRYLSEALLRRALNGENLDRYLFPENPIDEPKHGTALQGGAYWLTVEEIDALPEAFHLAKGKRHALRRLKLVAEMQVPRVTVDRVNSGSTLYHAGKTVFAGGCGLWLGVQPRDLAARHMFESAMANLAHDGLGGERSAGYGHFQFEPNQAETVTLGRAPAPNECMYLLARYIPRPDELPGALTSPQCAYTLTSVGGWFQAGDSPAQRRKKILMLAEGSLAAPGEIAPGAVVDVTPEYQPPAPALPHPIYRFGLATGPAWPLG